MFYHHQVQIPGLPRVLDNLNKAEEEVKMREKKKERRTKKSAKVSKYNPDVFKLAVSQEVFIQEKN